MAVTVFDAHCDSLLRILIDGADLARFPKGQADLPRWKKGGFGAQVFAVWADTIYVPHHAVKRSLQQIDAFHRFLDKYPNRVGLARTGSDIKRVIRSGRLAALLSIEGGDSIQKDLGVLRLYHRLGASSMTLTHSRTTDWADSSTDTPRWGGLNDFGREVIREMNRLRMIVDVSHVSDDTIRSVLEVSRQPIIASHSSCKALCSHPRNLSDELLKAIAKKGGVVGMNFYAEFLDQDYHNGMKAKHKDLLVGLNSPPQVAPEDMDRASADRLRVFFNDRLPSPPFERILDHIDHAVSVAGIDHVGIGADLDSGPIPLPEGFNSVADYPKVAQGMRKRGYSERDIKKVMSENFIRVFEKVTG